MMAATSNHEIEFEPNDPGLKVVRDYDRFDKVIRAEFSTFFQIMRVLYYFVLVLELLMRLVVLKKLHRVAWKGNNHRLKNRYNLI